MGVSGPCRFALSIGMLGLEAVTHMEGMDTCGGVGIHPGDSRLPSRQSRGDSADSQARSSTIGRAGLLRPASRRLSDSMGFPVRRRRLPSAGTGRHLVKELSLPLRTNRNRRWSCLSCNRLLAARMGLWAMSGTIGRRMSPSTVSVLMGPPLIASGASPAAARASGRYLQEASQRLCSGPAAGSDAGRCLEAFNPGAGSRRDPVIQGPLGDPAWWSAAGCVLLARWGHGGLRHISLLP